MSEIASHLEMGPRPGVQYPQVVQYCGNCGMPLEVIVQ